MSFREAREREPHPLRWGVGQACLATNHLPGSILVVRPKKRRVAASTALGPRERARAIGSVMSEGGIADGKRLGFAPQVIEAGFKIRVGIVKEAVHGVDTPEQLAELNKKIASGEIKM